MTVLVKKPNSFITFCLIVIDVLVKKQGLVLCFETLLLGNNYCSAFLVLFQPIF